MMGAQGAPEWMGVACGWGCAPVAGEKNRHLGGIRLFSELSKESLAHLERLCAWCNFSEGAEILTRNSTSREVFFVVEGAVSIVNYSTSGREIAYTIIEQGDYFGELAAIDQKPRSAHVVAVRPCLLAMLKPEAFEQALRHTPEIAWRVMHKLAAIIRINDERIMDLSTLGAPQRIHTQLLRLAKPDPVTAGRWMIYPLPTQNEMAARVSTTRETVARVISQLAGEGIVEKKGRTLYINKWETLAALSGQGAGPG